MTAPESNTQEVSAELSRTMVEENIASLTNADGSTLGVTQKWFESQGVNIFDDETDGIRNYPVLSKKEQESLIGKPMVLVSWKFNTSEKYKNDDGTPGQFVSVLVQYVDNAGRLSLGIINDGSKKSGIHVQMQELTRNRVANNHVSPYAGRGVKNGLRKSEYPIVDEKGNESVGVSWYLDF
jgi:hypothetical protein